jgi:hypothetical protein
MFMFYLKVSPYRMAASEQKYPQNNIFMVKNALLHHEDIDFSVPIDFIGQDIKWPLIADRLREAVNNPQKVFIKISSLTQKLLETKPRKQQKPKGPHL